MRLGVAPAALRARWDLFLLEWRANHQLLADRAGRWRQIVPVTQPVLLVSQIQRSGGTLLTRLLNGHPQCLSHPHELQWASKSSGRTPEWPHLDTGAPADVWWDRLHKRWIATLSTRGHLSKKISCEPLAFAPVLHREMFHALWQDTPPTSKREVFNHYFTALFNAWPDCAGIYAAPKRYVVAYAPQLLVSRHNRAGFWQDYPDGLLVSIVRRPDHWLASALSLRFSAWVPGEAADAVRQWKASVGETLLAHAEVPHQVLVVNFEALVESPVDVMGTVCRTAGISLSEGWKPTLNGRPVPSNSSLEARQAIDPAVLTRGDGLADEVRELIDQEAWDLYAAAMDAARRSPQGRSSRQAAPTQPLRPGPAMPALVRARWSRSDRGLVRARLAAIATVDAPLLLISQVQRSGGTLLSRLFDGHPECHAHPHELCWGAPKKRHWPDLPMHASADRWWRLLSQWWQVRTAATGVYHKHKADEGHYPLVLHRQLQKAIWRRCLAQSPPASQRDVLNASLTAFFNAWLDYQGWLPQPRQYVTAFTPGIMTTPGSLDRYWRDYPDGHLVCVVRDPQGWFASARVHHPRWRDCAAALADWTSSARSALEAQAVRPERVSVLLFDDLVGRTRAAMAHLCRRTGLSFHRSLLTPTFNTIEVVSNSNFVQMTGLDQTTRDRSSRLSALERSEIQARCGDLYSDVHRRFHLT